MTTDWKNLGKKQGGDPNIKKIGDINKVRPLDSIIAGWRQHGIEHPSDPEQFSSVVCPGARSCPLCRKPTSATGKAHFPVSRRFAANVWDYDTSAVKVLVAGPSIFDEFKGAATVGIDPSSCDWTITKSGQGLSTRYDVIRHDGAPFTAAQITPDMLHSVDKYEQPASTEAIFEILEKYGIDYDALTIPSYTYEQALAFTMPYTKHKGLTVEQLLQQEPSFAEWMHGVKLEQGQLGDPVFLALQTAMEERGLVPSLDDALQMLPDAEPTPAPTPQVTVNQAPVAEPVSASSANMVKLVGPTGDEVMVPSSAVDTMLLAGFTKWEPPAPATAVDANAPTKVIIGGQVVELPREQALMLISAGTATAMSDGATVSVAEPEPKRPKLPLPDEIVQVSLGGTQVPMPYVQAGQLVDNVASRATFVDPAVAEAHARVNEKLDDQLNAQESSAATETPVEAPDDPEKPFKCDECTAQYKTQGALTQHKNREHKMTDPQPSAIPVETNGGSVVERVKNKISTASFARDFTKMLLIFEEATGKKDFSKMTEEELLRLEARIDQETAAAAS